MNMVTAVETTLADLPEASTNKYPWKTMDIGHHFQWPGTKHAAYVAARRAGRRNNRKFVVRSTEEKVTVWRTE